MKDKPSSFFTGRLKFKSLFEGSKSEGLYPVLNVDDDHSFRLHIRGNSFGDDAVFITIILYHKDS